MGMTEGITINHKVKSNSSELAQVSLLVRELMGRKNVGTFSNEAGLSRGYVSRLINNKLKSKPSIRTDARSGLQKSCGRGDHRGSGRGGKRECGTQSSGQL